MQCWKNARATERIQFQAISIIFESCPQLLKFLFDPGNPRLKSEPEKLLKSARSLSSGEFILIKLAIDIWCSEGQLKVYELFELDSELFASVLKAFSLLNH
jgi:hypothetical protein